MNVINPVTLATDRYRLRFILAIGAYFVVLAGSLRTVEHVSGPLHYFVALAPVVPIAFIFIACVRYMQNTDELTRTIQLTSLAVSAGLTAMIAATYGFLENVGFPHPSAWFTYGFVMFVWACVQPFVARRYR